MSQEGIDSDLNDPNESCLRPDPLGSVIRTDWPCCSWQAPTRRIGSKWTRLIGPGLTPRNKAPSAEKFSLTTHFYSRKITNSDRLKSLGQRRRPCWNAVTSECTIYACIEWRS